MDKNTALNLDLGFSKNKGIQDIREIGRHLDDLEKRIDRIAKTGIGGDPAKVKRMKDEVKGAKDELVKYEKATKKAASEKGKFTKASTDSTKALGGLKKNLFSVGNIAKGLGFAGLAAGAIQLTRAVVQLGKESVTAFSELETKFSEIETLLIGTDFSDSQLPQFKNDIQQLGAEIGKTSDQLLPALYQALSAGVPQDNVVDFLRDANKGAVAGVTSLETSVDALSSVTNAYGLDVVSTARASDVLFTTVRLGKTTFSELGASISGVAPLASAIGVDFGEIGASLATITSQGSSTAEAVTGLKGALAELNKDGSKAATALKEITGLSFKDFIASGGTLQEALQALEAEAQSNNTTINNLFSNIRGGQAAIQLTGKATETFTSNLESMTGAVGATDAAFEKFDGNLAKGQARVDALKQQYKELLGESLAPLKEGYLNASIAALEFANSQTKSRNLLDGLREAREGQGSPSELNSVLSTNVGGNDADSIAKRLDALATLGDSAEEAEEKSRRLITILRIVGENVNATEDEIVALAQAEFDLADTTEQLGSSVQAETERFSRYKKAVEETTNALLNQDGTMSNNQGALKRYESTYEYAIANREAYAKAVADSELSLGEQASIEATLAKRVKDTADEIEANTDSREDAIRALSDLTGKTQAEISALVDEQLELRSSAQAQRDYAKAVDEANAAVSGIRSGASSSRGKVNSSANSDISDARVDAVEKEKELRTELEEDIAGLRQDKAEEILQLNKQAAIDRKASEKQIAEIRTSSAKNQTKILESAREAVEDRIEETSQLEQDLNKETADKLVDLGKDIKKELKEGEAEIAKSRFELEQKIAEARQAFLDQYAAQQVSAFQNVLGEVVSGDFEQQSTDDAIADVLLNNDSQDLDYIADALIAQGVATLEQVEAANAEIQRQAGREAIRRAIEEGTINADQIDDAFRELESQIANGEETNLEQFGVTIKTAEELATEATASLIAEREALAVQEFEFRQKLLEKEEAARDKIYEERANKFKEIINEESKELERIREQEQEDLANNKKLELERIETIVKTRLEKEAELQAERIRLSDELFELEQGRSQELLDLVAETNGQIAELWSDTNERIDEINQSRSEKITEINEKEREEIAATAQSLIDQFGAGSAEAVAAMEAVGISIDELPEEIQIQINENGDEVIAKAGQVDAAVQGIRDKTVTINVVENRETTQNADGSVSGGGLNRLHDGGVARAGQLALVGDDAQGNPTQFSEIIMPVNDALVISNDQLRTAINVVKSGRIPKLSALAGLDAGRSSSNLSNSSVSPVSSVPMVVPPSSSSVVNNAGSSSVDNSQTNYTDVKLIGRGAEKYARQIEKQVRRNRVADRLRNKQQVRFSINGTSN